MIYKPHRNGNQIDFHRIDSHEGRVQSGNTRRRNVRDRNKDTGERTEPTIEEWEEIDREMIRTGAYTVHDEQDEIEALENEEDRRMFVFYIVRERGKSHWLG